MSIWLLGNDLEQHMFVVFLIIIKMFIKMAIQFDILHRDKSV